MMVVGAAMGEPMRCEWAGSDDECADSRGRVLFGLLALGEAQSGLPLRTVLHCREWSAGLRGDRACGGVDGRGPGVSAAGRGDHSQSGNGRECAGGDRGIWAAGLVPVELRRRAATGERGWVDGGIPAETDGSQVMSKALKRAGFRFVGPTICYAFMQANGMMNDHEVRCLRYEELTAK